MSAVHLRALIAFVLVTSACCLDLQRLSDDCLRGRALPKLQDLNCVTRKGVHVHKIRQQNQTFYCFHYEKRTGNRQEFDILSFDLHDDYDLKYTGANVMSNEVENPKFKLFDSRSKQSYKGRFAFSSENPSFVIRKAFVNEVEEICYDNNFQVWPSITLNGHNFDESQESTTQKAFFATTPSPGSCGQVKKVDTFGNYLALSSSPGEFPWSVAIYRYFDEDEESYYKCAGTIIDKKTIVTSVNCLLDDGLLLKPDELQVYTSHFSLSAKMQQFRLYNVARVVTHSDYNLKLENNIAALKLSRVIDFNDYVQPICVPEDDYSATGKIGKLAGFGKSSSTHQPKSDLLTAAEYEVRSVDGNSFEAVNTSGNNQISDIGSGLYINETNRWMLAGIMSKKTRVTTNDMPSHVFTFTNVPKYSNWIQSLNNP